MFFAIESLLRENEILYDQNEITDLSPIKALLFNMGGQHLKIVKEDFQNEDRVNEVYNALLVCKDQEIILFAEYEP